MVIPKKKSLRQNIDVFLKPLIDELKILWDDGIVTYDTFWKQKFILWVALLWKINDFLAYGTLSKWNTHGHLSCLYCMEHVKSFILEHGKETFLLSSSIFANEAFFLSIKRCILKTCWTELSNSLLIWWRDFETVGFNS